MELCGKNEENPWMVEELEEFLYYCCPECDEKCRAKGLFLQHALCNHPNAVPCLKKYETMKVEQITITPDESMIFNIKQESKDENQIDKENSCQDMFDYNDDSESDLVKNESKTESQNDSKNSGFSEETATFSCKHCNENFDEARLLILHISEKHKEDSNVKNLAKKQKNQKTPCGECGKLYSDSGLRAHMIRAHGNRAKTFKCDHCDYRSAMKQTLTSHVRIVHEKEKHQHFCSVCGKKFANRTLAAKHEEVVHFSKEPAVQVDQKQYECNKCGAKQMTDKNYKKHLRIVHGEHPDDSVTCDKCGKSFTNLRRCRDHIKIMHPSAEELAKVQCDCEKCFKVFSSALDLNVHLKECLENPPNLTCILCMSGNWLSAIALKKHSAETHEKYLQVCNICQAAFETYNQLKEHRNTVHREKKKTIHSCPHCDKQFEIKKTMTYHMFNVHGDEKVAHFSCDKCDYKSKAHWQLKEHVNALHTKAEVFQCTFCEFNTYRRKNLYNHVKIVHEKYKPNKCDKCFASFHYKRDLDNHMARQHPGMLDDS